MQKLLLCLAPAILIFPIYSTYGQVREYSQVITGNELTYEIEVGGIADPVNVEITIENLGETAVRDPRISINGRYDWFDLSSLVNEITQDCSTDEDKALAIWEWLHWKRFQRSPGDDGSLHPVRNMNCYGYGICGHSSAMLKAMWQEAGLQARVQEIWGHTISEVYYNGAWHMLDGNVKVFYTARDNRTIASLAELEKDGWLIERAIHPRDLWVRQDDPPGRNEEFVRYIVTTGDNYEEKGYDKEIAKPYNMSYQLKPGETLIRWWEPVLQKYEGRDKRPQVPERYANGQLIWEPDLTKTDIFDYLNVIENITTTQRDQVTPAIHVATPQNDNYTRAARFSIPVNSAYPVVGGKFWCTLHKDPGTSISLSYGTPPIGTGNLYTYRWGDGLQDVEIYLDQFLLGDESPFSYDVGVTATANGRDNKIAQVGIETFKLVSDLQVSPHSLPALSAGKNVVRYRDSSPGAGKKIRITHKWVENNSNRPPEAVSEPVTSGEVSTLTPTLKWKPAVDQDKGDKVTDYQVMVSLREDCRWPLSVSLHRNVGSDKCEWKVLESFLNPGTTYYWKVRARDSKGAEGDWGRVFSFRTSDKAK